MLEREDGPVVIEDSPDDDPRAQPDPAWRPPLDPVAANGSVGALAGLLEAEIPRLQEAHQRWQGQHARSAVGLSGLSVADAGRYVADWLRGKGPPSPRDGYSVPLLLRFAIDDLKAYYLEAAAGGASKPSSHQLGDWLWNGTAAGAGLHALREACLASDDERLKLIAGNFIVPAARMRQAG